jgi:hypothetical protein
VSGYPPAGPASARDTLGASPGTVVIALATILWMVLVAIDLEPLHLLGLAYLVVVPGLAITRAAGLRTSAASLSLGVVLSVGLVGVVYGLLLAAGTPSALLVRAIVVAVTIGALAVDEYMTSTRPGVSLEEAARSPSGGAPVHHDD